LPSRSANSIHVMKMCQALSRNGHDVSLLGIANPQYNDEVNIYNYYNVSSSFDILLENKMVYKGISTIQYSFKNRSKIKNGKKNIELLYARDINTLFASSNLNIPFIFEVHDIPANSLQYNVQKYLFSRRYFLKLVVISSALRDEYLRIFPRLQADKVLVAHDGADDNHQNGQVKLLSDRQDRIKVGYIGHLYQGRGIEIIEEMAKQCDWAEFHLIGGTVEDITYWKQKMSGASNVYLYGYIPFSETDQYRKSFDVLIAPYQNKVAVYGGKGDTSKWMSPLKIFEYMAAGKPVLCSDLPVLREVLKDGHNALLCKPDVINDWISALKSLNEDKALRNRIGKNAKRDFIENYTWKARANHIISEELIQSNDFCTPN
jgi:glycosyltransferase involved in cell wall biosynthesis